MIKEALAAANVQVWPSAALLIFFVLMIIVTAWIYHPRRVKELENYGKLPLHDVED